VLDLFDPLDDIERYGAMLFGAVAEEQQGLLVFGLTALFPVLIPIDSRRREKVRPP